ncbi:MAG: outer membrane beta-barrel family protein [Chitinophagaceae bacterium]|nr:outer membrane beta-barrel family protein [Chitinophagaceae bacterium]
MQIRPSFSNSNSFTRGLSQQHSLRGKYEWKIDSLASIKFSIAGTQREKTQNTESSTVTQVDDYSGNLRLLNENDRTNDLFSRKRELDNVLTYKQLFKKKNRQLITTLRLGLIEDNGNEMLQSETNIYNNGVLSEVELIDQMKLNDGRSRTAGVRLTYNEPLTEKLNLVTEYSLNHNASESHRNSYDNDGFDKYIVKNDEFSNNFDLTALSNSGTITARYMSKKLRMVAGAGLSSINLNLKNLDQETKKKYNFLGFTPQAQVAFIRSQQSQISFSYRGNTVQPTLNQLQPLRNNTDPLSVYIGNPDLKVAFNHSLSFNYNDFRVLSGRSLFANLGITFHQNAITQSSTLKGGKRTYMPVNVDGNYNYYLWSAWNSGQGDKKWIHQISPQISGGRSANIIENVTNINTYATFSINYNLRYSLMDKFNMSIGPSASRSLSKSSLAPDVNNNFWTYGGRGYLWVKLPKKFELVTDIESNLRQKTEAFPNVVNITVWNAKLSRKFFKDNSFQLDLYAYDILNQNIGFTRNINSNFMTEQRFDRISQYFMLSAIWTFNKMPGGK